MPFPTNMPGALDGFTDGVDVYHADVINALEKIVVGPVFFNARGYGADNTGALACDTAITAAIAAMPTAGGALYFPAGTYKFVSPIAPGAKHVKIVGAGRDPDGSLSPTVLSYQPAGAGTTAITISSHSCILEGFVLLQGNASATTKGIVLSGAFMTTIRDVTVTGFTGAGITYQALSAASVIWNTMINVRVAACTVGLDLIGFPSTSRVVNNNGFYECQFTGNAVGSPNVRLTGGTSENGFYSCDVTGGNAQTLVQIGDGVNTCRGNRFDSCTAEGGGGGGIGFQLQAASAMTWIAAECTSTTKVSAPGGVTGFFWDHIAQTWNTFGNINFQFDATGNVTAQGSVTATSLTLTTAASVVIPGATNLSFYNHAGAVQNLIITDAGVVTHRSDLVLGTAPRILTTGTVPTVGSGGAGTSALSILANSTNTSGRFQVTLTAVAPGVVAGVVAFGGAPLATAPLNVVCSLSAPTAGVAAPPNVGADTYTTSGFTVRVYGPTTVTTGTYVVNYFVTF